MGRGDIPALLNHSRRRVPSEALRGRIKNEHTVIGNNIFNMKVFKDRPSVAAAVIIIAVASEMIILKELASNIKVSCSGGWDELLPHYFMQFVRNCLKY